MTLGNFYEIMVDIIGIPSNDYEQFLIYTCCVGLGIFIILFVFQLFMIISNMLKIRQK